MGVSWTYSEENAYDGNVTWTDNTAAELYRRERPHMIVDKDGNPLEAADSVHVTFSDTDPDVDPYATNSRSGGNSAMMKTLVGGEAYTHQNSGVTIHVCTLDLTAKLATIALGTQKCSGYMGSNPCLVFLGQFFKKTVKIKKCLCTPTGSNGPIYNNNGD